MISSTSFSTSSSFVCRCSACEKASSRCYTYYGILTMTTLTMAMRLREGELIEQPRRGGGLAVARLEHDAISFELGALAHLAPGQG